jgi:hypothetical protein
MAKGFTLYTVKAVFNGPLAISLAAWLTVLEALHLGTGRPARPKTRRIFSSARSAIAR